MGAIAQDAQLPRQQAAAPARRSAAATAAWLAAPPTAVLVLLAILVLGPPLGRLSPTPSAHFWPGIVWLVHPEPTEHARFLIALTAPLLLSALTLRLAHRPLPLADGVSQRLATTLEASAVAFGAACLVLQRTALFRLSYEHGRIVYFTFPTLAVAALLAAAALVIARRPALTERIAGWARDSPARTTCAVLVAVAAVAITVLPAVCTEASVTSANDEFVYHLRFIYDETAAVLDGRSPLGDFAAQYSSLWPYLLAAAVSPFGGSIGLFTVAMALLTSAAMLALFAVLRRVTRSALLALALFLPLLATSAFRLHGASVARFSLIDYFGTMPLRYAGPFLLAGLVARHLDGARPRRAWPLFAAAGLIAINNSDFGLAALAATVGALLWGGPPPTAARLRALARDLALGLVVAVGAVCALLLARTGGLPDPSLAFRYARLFAVDGFGMERIYPQLGMSTIVYLTYVAAVGTATVLALRGPADRLLAGMLAWSGVFGLGIGGYYAGRSIGETLTNMFPAWALAVTLLTVVVVRTLVARTGRRPRAIELACLFAFGLLACSLAQTPSPIAQARRIATDGPHFFARPPIETFVAEHVARGESIAMLTELGHRVAYNLGAHDVTPYTGIESIQTREQLEQTLALLRAAGGRKVFVAVRFTPSGVREALAADGLRRVAASDDGVYELWAAR